MERSSLLNIYIEVKEMERSSSVDIYIEVIGEYFNWGEGDEKVGIVEFFK